VSGNYARAELAGSPEESVGRWQGWGTGSDPRCALAPRRGGSGRRGGWGMAEDGKGTPITAAQAYM